MNKFMGIMKVVGAGAAAALGVLAVPFTAGASITVTVGVIAAVTGVSAAGAAAGALYHESPNVSASK